MTTNYERFQSHVDVSGGSGSCHPWMLYRDKDGYGRFKADGKSYRPARWLLGYLRGAELTRDELALHHCDNPPCVNREHLYVGSEIQNHRDAVARGRARAPVGDANRAKTHCANGHPYDSANTAHRSDRIGRECRACNREAVRKGQARKALLRVEEASP